MSEKISVPYEEVVAWRRHLHQHPELSFEEYNTAKFVTETLQSFGLEVEHPTPTSVTAIIKGTAPGAETGKCVGWRADMDALPLNDETGESFASQNPGVAHACGHDAHTAMALGIAKVLCENRHLLAGSVKMIFQHGEEKNPGGAQEMIAAGVCDDLDAIYAIHVMNQALGTLSVHKGAASTIAGGTYLKIKGKGAHGSMPHTGIDPLVCATFITNALYTIPARDVEPGQMAIVNVGMLDCGGAPNIVPEELTLGISLRTADDDVYEILQTRASEIIDGFTQAFRCQAEYAWVPTYPVVENDERLCDIAYQAAQEVLGDKAFWGPGTTASEDFSRFTKIIPGCFLLLGAGNADNGLTFTNHNPQFNIVEDCLATGVEAGVAILTKFLAVENA